MSRIQKTNTVITRRNVSGKWFNEIILLEKDILSFVWRRAGRWVPAIVLPITAISCVESDEDQRLRRLEDLVAKQETATKKLPPLGSLMENASRGDPEAQAQLGMRYRYGETVAQDYKIGYDWLIKAAKQGHAEAQREVAAYYYYLSTSQSFDIPTSIKSLSPNDRHNRALFWYSEAAKGCDGEAMYNMSHIGEGRGLSGGLHDIPPNNSLAVDWMMRAAGSHFNRAIYDLSEWYLDGHLVDRNVIEALAWNSVAQALDLEPFSKRVSEVRTKASPELFERAKKRSEELLEQSSKNKCRARTRYESGDAIPVFPD